MGHLQAQGYADAVRQGLAHIGAVIQAHLVGNFYPPLPASLVEPAILALALVAAGLEEAPVDLAGQPVGIRGYGHLVPAGVVVDKMRLSAFVGLVEPVRLVVEVEAGGAVEPPAEPVRLTGALV